MQIILPHPKSKSGTDHVFFSFAYRCATRESAVMRTIKRGLSLILLFLAVTAAAQDNWPSKPVRFIVPSSPGGGTDVYARILAQALGDALKAQFIVDNRPGASGNIGAAA